MHRDYIKKHGLELITEQMKAVEDVTEGIKQRKTYMGNSNESYLQTC